MEIFKPDLPRRTKYFELVRMVFINWRDTHHTASSFGRSLYAASVAWIAAVLEGCTKGARFTPPVHMGCLLSAGRSDVVTHSATEIIQHLAPAAPWFGLPSEMRLDLVRPSPDPLESLVWGLRTLECKKMYSQSSQFA